MDPQACFEAFIGHTCDGDRAEAHSSISDLWEWVDKGGFCPVFPGGEVKVPVNFIKNCLKFTQKPRFLGYDWKIK